MIYIIFCISYSFAVVYTAMFFYKGPEFFFHFIASITVFSNLSKKITR